ncbi:MAG: type I secretion system permease/ATPase [Pikeienuella sp.]
MTTNPEPTPGPRPPASSEGSRSNPETGAGAQAATPARQGDPLAASLAHALKLRGRDVSPEALAAGLPREAAGLTPELALRAAEAQRTEARITRRALGRITDAVLPVVLFLNDRDACVLIERRQGGRALIFRPDESDTPFEIGEDALGADYAGAALLLRPEPWATPGEDRPEPGRARHWFWGATMRFWPSYLQVALAAGLVNVLALATPIFTMNVYDRVFPNAATTTLWALVAGIGIALGFDALLKMVRASIVDDVGRRADVLISARLFRHLADLKLEDRTGPSGRLVNHLKDFEQVREFFSSQTVATLTDLLFAGLFLFVIWRIGGPLAYPPIAAVVAALVLGLITLWPLRRSANAARAQGAEKNAVAVEAFADLETMKAIGGQSRMQKRWENFVEEAGRAQRGMRFWSNFATTMAATFQQMASIAIVVIGVYLALDGEVTMGAVIAAMILSGRAMAPCAALAGLFVRGSFAASTLKSLNATMRLRSDAAGDARTMNAAIEEGALALENVSLTYGEMESPALSGVTLTIRPGERVGVIGAVGSGKSTLVRLLAGLYEPSEGEVFVDGLNMRQIEPARLRAAIRLAPQDTTLFSGSLRENIAFGAPGAADDEILRAARAGGADMLARGHPAGFDMPIAERGRNLSGGQRQLVALSRALLRPPRVLLLDEPTSAMDSQTETAFQRRLEEATARYGFSVVISSHRMRLLTLADRLIYLERGRIALDGPRAEVIDALQRRAAPVKTKVAQAAKQEQTS